MPAFYEHFAQETQSAAFYSLCLGPQTGHLVLGGTKDAYKGRLVASFAYDPATLQAATVQIANGTSARRASHSCLVSHSDSLVNLTQPINLLIDSSQIDTTLSPDVYASFVFTFRANRCNKLPYLCDKDNINNTIFGVGDCYSLTKDVIPRYCWVWIAT